MKPPLTPELLAASYVDPVFYAREILKVPVLAPYQERILRDLVDHEQVAARSANGVGKSFLAGVALSWFFDTRRRPVCFVAGPKLEKAQIPFRVMLSLRDGSPFALPGEPYDGGLYGDGDRKDWYVMPTTAREAEAFAGIHAGDVFGIVEEASGEPDAIYEAIFGCLTGERDRILHIGNPTRSEGVFSRLWKMEGVATHTISAYDSPNVIEGREVVPGLISRAGVARIVETFGAESDVTRVRVHGLPPRGSGDNIFGIDAISEARGRGGLAEPLDEYLAEVGGLDLARMGADSSALLTVRGKRLVGVQKWEKLDIVESAERVRPWLVADPRRLLALDVGGLGAGVYDILRRRHSEQLIPVNFGGRQVMGKMRGQAGGLLKDRTPWYWDRRSELWYEAAAWLREVGEISEDLPDDVLQELESDLLAPVGGQAPNQSLRMESKDQTRKRLGRSPDLGDAFCLAVAALMYHARGMGEVEARVGRPRGVFGEVLSPQFPGRLRAVSDGGGRRAGSELSGWSAGKGGSRELDEW